MSRRETIAVNTIRMIRRMIDRHQSLAAQLFVEWDQLRHRRHALEHAAGWQVVEGPLDDLDQVLAAIGYGVPASPSTEAALRTLVEQAADDELAARVVAQRLMPGLLAQCRRRRSFTGDDVFAELFGAAWMAIRTFRPTRQPGCLAAALVNDADDRAFRRRWRQQRHEESPRPAWTFDTESAEASPTASDELAWVVERAVAAGLDDEQLGDLHRFASGRSTHELAAELKISERAVRYRHQRLTRELQRLLCV